MTADVELLPLPNLWKYEGSGVISARITPDDTREYARANVLHHTAAKDAEIEALRAEVGELHMSAKRRDQYAVEKAAQAADAIARAERLAELLDQAYGHVPAGALADQIHCALLRDQEEGK